MRVIAGEKRGMKLISPLGQEVRPTYDRVREAVFGRLQFFIPGKTVLDLFAGSGAMGIEALSRGASFAYFVDWSAQALLTLQSNIRKANYQEKCKIIKNDYISALKLFKKNVQFDIVFIDPPYASGYYEKALQTIETENLLKTGAQVVLESEGMLDFTIKNYTVKKAKKYGKTTITYLEYTP